MGESRELHAAGFRDFVRYWPSWNQRIRGMYERFGRKKWIGIITGAYDKPQQESRSDF